MPNVNVAVPEAPKAWRFRCFRSLRGEDLIDEWAKKLSKKGKVKLTVALEYLCVQPRTEWSRPHASPLGNHIYVIRFKDENGTQHRLAGHFHEESYVFVLTQPVIEKDNQYDPSNYEDLAAAHKLNCDGDLDARTCTCFHLAPHEREDELSSSKSVRSGSWPGPVTITSSFSSKLG